MSAAPPLAPDAAMVLGIASTAMPFARTREDEAERWLRLLRLHGEAGAALQALGVSDGAIEEGGKGLHPDRAPRGGETEDERDAVARIAQDAAGIARGRDARAITTADVLSAVMHFYGEDFDRVLHAHGTERSELLDLLGAARAAS